MWATAAPAPADTEAQTLLSALLGQSSTLVDSASREHVLQRLCDTLVAASPHIRLAWIWIGAENTPTITPSIYAGPAASYARTLRIPRNWITRMGPVLQALREGRAATMSVRRWAPFGPWRQAAREYGFAQALALPLPEAERVGVVVFYADTADYFDRVGVAPFEAFVRVACSMLQQCARVHQLQLLANHDPLTALLNRRGMLHLLQQHWAATQQRAERFALILVDIDRFKLLNDSFGHLAGDAALLHAAHLLQRGLRAEDAIARWGGEEFLLLLPGADEERACEVAERLRRNLHDKPVTFGDHALDLTASFGVLAVAQASTSLDHTLSRLDALLYDAKRSGRDCVRSPAHGESGTLSAGARLQLALQQGRVRPAYQPLVDLASGKVVAYEALARLVEPSGQVVPAAAFIEAAHRLRLEHRIDAAISAQSLQHCAAAQRRGEDVKHFLNFSADFLGRPERMQALIDHVRGLCHDCPDTGHIKPVVIELTERQLLPNLAQTRAQLAPLLDFGFELALDDFGSGYSSLLYLLDLPVRYLKVEAALVQRAQHEPSAEAVVRSIAAMAHDLGILTIAEGIETPEQRDCMARIGLDWGQGYFWGRPELALNTEVPTVMG